MTVQQAPEHLIDSRYAMWRLVKALVIMVMGSSCMFIVSVVLPEVQAEFGVSRSEASLPSTLLWIGFGFIFFVEVVLIIYSKSHLSLQRKG